MSALEGGEILLANMCAYRRVWFITCIAYVCVCWALRGGVGGRIGEQRKRKQLASRTGALVTYTRKPTHLRDGGETTLLAVPNTD
jgi:hypothetical protein